MLFPSITELAVMRRRLGLTQSQLAKAAGVSQSLVAKVESNRLDPSYSNAVSLFEALERLGKRHEKTAGQLMGKKVISCSPKDSLKRAAHLMKSHEISQMPVMDGASVEGVITETDVLGALVEGKKGALVGDVMESAPPIVDASTSANALSSLLRHCSLVLVGQKGKIVGVVGRSDLFASLE